MLTVPNPGAENLVAVFRSNTTGYWWDGVDMDIDEENAAGVPLLAVGSTTLAELAVPALPDDQYAVLIYARQGASLDMTSDPVPYAEAVFDSRQALAGRQADLEEILLAAITGKMVVDEQAGTWTLYAADGLTVLHSGTRQAVGNVYTRTKTGP